MATIGLAPIYYNKFVIIVYRIDRPKAEYENGVMKRYTYYADTYWKSSGKRTEMERVHGDSKERLLADVKNELSWSDHHSLSTTGIENEEDW